MTDNSGDKRAPDGENGPAAKKTKREELTPSDPQGEPSDWFTIHQNGGSGDCAFISVAQAMTKGNNKQCTPEMLAPKGTCQAAYRLLARDEMKKRPTHYLPLTDELEERLLYTIKAGNFTEADALHALGVAVSAEIRVWSKSKEGLWKLFTFEPLPRSEKKKAALPPVVWLLLRSQHYEWMEPKKSLTKTTIKGWVKAAITVRAGVLFGGGGGGSLPAKPEKAEKALSLGPKAEANTKPDPTPREAADAAEAAAASTALKAQQAKLLTAEAAEERTAATQKPPLKPQAQQVAQPQGKARKAINKTKAIRRTIHSASAWIHEGSPAEAADILVHHMEESEQSEDSEIFEDALGGGCKRSPLGTCTMCGDGGLAFERKLFTPDWVAAANLHRHDYGHYEGRVCDRCGRSTCIEPDCGRLVRNTEDAPFHLQKWRCTHCDEEVAMGGCESCINQALPCEYGDCDLCYATFCEECMHPREDLALLNFYAQGSLHSGAPKPRRELRSCWICSDCNDDNPRGEFWLFPWSQQKAAAANLTARVAQHQLQEQEPHEQNQQQTTSSAIEVAERWSAAMEAAAPMIEAMLGRIRARGHDELAGGTKAGSSASKAGSRTPSSVARSFLGIRVRLNGKTSSEDAKSLAEEHFERSGSAAARSFLGLNNNKTHDEAEDDSETASRTGSAIARSFLGIGKPERSVKAVTAYKPSVGNRVSQWLVCPCGDFTPQRSNVRGYLTQARRHWVDCQGHPPQPRLTHSLRRRGVSKGWARPTRSNVLGK